MGGELGESAITEYGSTKIATNYMSVFMHVRSSQNSFSQGAAMVYVGIANTRMRSGAAIFFFLFFSKGETGGEQKFDFPQLFSNFSRK